MIIKTEIDHQTYSADLSKGRSIAITLLPNEKQPNHFGAPECTSEVLMVGDFIGDTKQGGSCNVNQLTIIPHCNGTHTESISHIVNHLVPVYKAIEESFFSAILITINPQPGYGCTESYAAGLDQENKVITKQQLEFQLRQFSNHQLQGLIIRTLPNDINKKSRVYDANNYPPFLTNQAMNYLLQRNVKHLMVDFPSVDKMYDEGMLSNHRIFWQVNQGDKDLSQNSDCFKTITEMVFVNSEIKDGFYLCNLQIAEIETDAVPSRPMLFKLRCIN